MSAQDEHPNHIIVYEDDDLLPLPPPFIDHPNNTLPRQSSARRRSSGQSQQGDDREIQTEKINLIKERLKELREKRRRKYVEENGPSPAPQVLQDQIEQKTEVQSLRSKEADCTPIREVDTSPKILLVIDYSINWSQIFRNIKLPSDAPIIVEQTQWKSITLQSSSKSGCVVNLAAEAHPFPFTSQKYERTVKPDFVLVRNFPTALHEVHYKNILMGLMFANIPAVNNLFSVFMGMHRALVYSEMNKLGSPKSNIEFRSRGKIPLVPMNFHPNISSAGTEEKLLTDPTPLPLVVKVGSPHAGYGKMKAQNQSDYDDLKSILKLHKDFYTTEPLVDFEYEFRIQKIGPHYRAFKRNSSSCWKNNWGNLEFVDHELLDKHKKWLDDVSTIFGGLDILALDVLHLENGEEIILELNDTAFGLMWEHEKEDCWKIRDVVVEKMTKAYC